MHWIVWFPAPKGLFPPEPAHYRGPKLKVAIIGAGLAGMSTAVELLDQGHEVFAHNAPRTLISLLHICFFCIVLLELLIILTLLELKNFGSLWITCFKQHSISIIQQSHFYLRANLTSISWKVSVALKLVLCDNGN